MAAASARLLQSTQDMTILDMSTFGIEEHHSREECGVHQTLPG